MLVRIQIHPRMAPCASCTIRATPSRFRLLTVRPAAPPRGEELYRLVRGAGLDARAPRLFRLPPSQTSFDAPRAPILLPLAGPSSSSARTFALAHTDNAFPSFLVRAPTARTFPITPAPKAKAKARTFNLVCDRRSSASRHLAQHPVTNWSREMAAGTGRWGGAHTIMMRAQLKLVLRTARR
ncbi:hypothetical protein B0H14DRAFT_2874735 [Mycena olivaceomarginata]|nr:hypothetical protein B0H14DRAFT_2874735 [Mycena olivaceomarginata]